MAQTFPVAQLVPSGRGLQAEEFVAGWQLAQALAALTVPETNGIPPMVHSVPHCPPPQYWPPPQARPSATLENAEVDVAD